MAACAFFLASCQFETKWQDETGQNHSEAQALVDTCDAQAGLDDNSPKTMSFDAFQTAARQASDCMAARGWKLVRA
jgi:hypothetical protein